MTKPPAGPWVLVVGMHRSGTSAATGALVTLGLNPCRLEDRMDWPESNPEHWESLSLGLHNESILAQFDGEWNAPPEFPDDWEIEGDLGDAADPGGLLAAAYPEPGPSVWKDPRLCLLLPYWRTVLPPPIAAVLVWRPPLAVADSLFRRDGLPIADGLALWERYNRSAIQGLAGVDTFVIDYDSLVDDPDRFLGQLADWLGSMPQFRAEGGSWDLSKAAGSILGDANRSREAADQVGTTSITPEQAVLADYLSSIGGGHLPLQPELPVGESVWTESVLRLRSKLSAPHRELDAALDQLRVTRVQLDSTSQGLANLRSSTSWRITSPLRSLTTSIENLRHGRSGR